MYTLLPDQSLVAEATKLSVIHRNAPMAVSLPCCSCVKGIGRTKGSYPLKSTPTVLQLNLTNCYKTKLGQLETSSDLANHLSHVQNLLVV